MRVHEAMTDNATFIPQGTTIAEAARRMREIDCGFLPIADREERKLQGVVTDRDIVTRGVAEGLDANGTSVETVKSDGVLYCFRDDDIGDAAGSMHEQQVYRLCVLDSRDSKQLVGVISLGDIARQAQAATAGKAVEGIAA